jgi:hypothetical protein
MTSPLNLIYYMMLAPNMQAIFHSAPPHPAFVRLMEGFWEKYDGFAVFGSFSVKNMI